jgi:prevent-host-death family protein
MEMSVARPSQKQRRAAAPARAAVAIPRRVWKLEDAKARFSEVVKLALSEGPQRVTRRGRPAVLVVADSDDGGQASLDAPGNWVAELREGISGDIDIMALIGPREKHDRGSRRDPFAKLLRGRRR